MEAPTPADPASIRALTLWEPWATLVGRGEKRIETRSWGTLYRGPLAIHSAARVPPTLPVEVERLAAGRIGVGWRLGVPRGAVTCLVMLRDVVRIPAEPERLRAGGEIVLPQGTIVTHAERELGDYRPFRYAWLLGPPVWVQPPIPAHGRQGLWNWTPRLHALEALAELLTGETP